MYSLDTTALDQIRETHKITSDEKLAAKLGVTRGTIRNLRKGHQPSLKAAKAVANLSGRTLDSLIIEISARAA